MSEETIYIIKNNPIINRFLREESYYYKYLYRDNNYIREIERLAKEKYRLTTLDKIEDKINLIKLFIEFLW